MSKKLTFISSALQGQNLNTLKSMAKTDNRQFRQLARKELKLYNQQLRRTGKSDFLTIRGKSNEQVLELLKKSRTESNKKGFYKSKAARTKRSRRKSQTNYYSKQGRKSKFRIAQRTIRNFARYHLPLYLDSKPIQGSGTEALK